LIKIRNKQKRTIQEDPYNNEEKKLQDIGEANAGEEDDEVVVERRFTVFVDHEQGGFKGLPEELQRQLDSSGFDK
jgi:hypothetical protein